jgi:hypothetical protein
MNDITFNIEKFINNIGTNFNKLLNFNLNFNIIEDFSNVQQTERFVENIVFFDTYKLENLTGFYEKSTITRYFLIKEDEYITNFSKVNWFLVRNDSQIKLKDEIELVDNASNIKKFKVYYMYKLIDAKDGQGNYLYPNWISYNVIAVIPSMNYNNMFKPLSNWNFQDDFNIQIDPLNNINKKITVIREKDDTPDNAFVNKATQDEVERVLLRLETLEDQGEATISDINNLKNQAQSLVDQASSHASGAAQAETTANTAATSAQSNAASAESAVENTEQILAVTTGSEPAQCPPETFQNISEGFVEGMTSQERAANKMKSDVLYRTSELLVQRDNIMNNLVGDYMINNEEGTNFSKMYKKLNQNNTNKLRKIGINTYYTKAYKEYINIIKVIILMTLIIIPVLILNNNFMLPHNVTKIIVIAVVFLTILYLISKFTDLYMRDNKNFDKIRIPYDRTAKELEKSGVIQQKLNPLNSMGITCIGDECCDASMIYDNLRNKCVLTENFGGYFESMANNVNMGTGVYVEPMLTEGFINSADNVANDLKVESLSNSTINKMNREIFISNPRIN